MTTFSEIEKMVGYGYDVFNVLTEDSNWTTKDGKSVKTSAKTPCKHGKYAFKGWEKATHEELKEAISYNHNGFGLRLGEQHNKCRIMSLDFDICGDKDHNGDRIGCAETAALWEQYKNGVEREDGIYSSSTEGNWNVLIDYSDCDDITELIARISIAKIGKHHLEILLAKNQVIPPTATTCKRTGKLGKPRTFKNEIPFYRVATGDFVYGFIKQLMGEYLEKQVKTNVPRVVSVASVSESEDDKCSREYNKNDKYYKLLFETLGNGFNEQGGKMIEWDQWVRVCSALQANKYPRDMWLDWCTLSSCSVKNEAESLWDNFEKRPARDINIRTLDSVAKLYKPKEYAIWRLKYEVSAICDNESKDAIKMLLSIFNPKAPTRVCFTDSVFGQLFKALYGDKFVYCCDIIYHFNDIYWEADNKKHTNIQHFINTTFITDLKRWIRDKITYYASKNSEDTETEENSNDDKYLVFWTKLNLYVTEYLQTQKATEQLIKMVCSKICNDSQKWDLNPYMFVFKNCVFDLKDGKVTTPNPADFMTTCCGWEYDFNYKCDDKLVKLVHSIQPIQDVHDYLLQAYSTGMIGIQNRNVFIFTGTGGNGKSVLDELLFAMLGGYSYTLPKEFLTQPFKEGANPAVMNLHNKRAVLVSEPDANKNIVCSSLKAMSGDSKISSRGLYGDIETINITATNFIECNTAPDLDEMNDAMTDRLGEGVINFDNKFVKKSVWESATDEERAGWAGIQDLYYKSDDFKTTYRQCFFDMLVPYVMKSIKVPSSVVASSSRYLTKSDPIYPFLLEHYEKVDGSVIKVKDFHSKLVHQNGYSWTKQQKEKFGSIRKFEDEVKKNVFMRKLIKDRNDYYDKVLLRTLSICGWKEKEEEQIEE